MEFLQQTSKAYEFAQKYLHTRTGFGALSHFHKIGCESMLLAVNSSFYKGSKPHYLMITYDLRSFIKDDLTKPNSYDPPALWALFWALAKAEHNFLSRYIPHWSNEERLTGHFVSQIIERIEDFNEHWMYLSHSNPAYKCRVGYADTATQKGEKVTGADLGLVIHANLQSQNSFIKVARLQAKKVEADGKARIEIKQLKKLHRDNLGYYLFYHQENNDKWHLPPTVLSTNVLENLLDVNSETKTISVHEQGYDFATFLTFGLADLNSDVGVVVDSPEEALYTLTSQRDFPLDRLLVITLGEINTDINWELQRV